MTDEPRLNPMAMSENSLTRLVQQETGLTFGRWRQQFQLIVAIRSLTSGKTVQQISGDLGSESVSAFITMFKKALGASPANYLRKIGYS
ncbi:helix-turn-helix domain-containing protein [Brucellaceae bacterium C25G]